MGLLLRAVRRCREQQARCAAAIGTAEDYPGGARLGASDWLMEEILIVIEYITKDSGEREHFANGGKRDARAGKGRFDLIPPAPMLRLAQAYERGAVKYDDRNWEKGFPFSRCLDSAMRHLNGYLMGKRDEDHLAAAVFNIFAVMHFEQFRPDLNDLTPPCLEPEKPKRGRPVGSKTKVGRVIAEDTDTVTIAFPETVEVIAVPMTPEEMRRTDEVFKENPEVDTLSNPPIATLDEAPWTDYADKSSRYGDGDVDRT